MKRLLTVLLCFFSLHSFSQSISQAEYFFNTDPGTGNATAITITAGDTVNFTASINTNLTQGFHTLNIRTRDNMGVWGLTESRTVYVSNNAIGTSAIVAAEYYFDADPGQGNGSAASIGASGDTVNFIAAIPTTLAAGFHTLNFRSKDANGIWGLTEARAVYVSNSAVNSTPVVAAEYFIDADPGTGNATAVSIGTTGDTVNFIAGLPTTLPLGFHTLNIRAKGAEGTWGLTESRAFYIAATIANAAQINTIEYFIDADPGFGNAAQLGFSATDTTNQSLLIALPAGLADGQHFLIASGKNTEGIWGLVTIDTFNINSVLPVTLLQFTATKQNNTSLLKWLTTNEVNNSHFIIEKSINGIVFAPLANVPAAQQTSVQNNYSYADVNPANGLNYYRLQQVDKDGKHTYSNIVQLMFNSVAGKIQVFPNPATSDINFSFPSTQRNILINLYDGSGKHIMRKSLTAQRVMQLNIAQLARGTYTFTITDGITNETGKFIKH